MISSVDSRLALMNAKKKLKFLAKKYGRVIDWSTTRLSQSYLRTEITFDQFTTSYTFPIIVNEGGGQTGKKEVRLALQDTFFVSHVGFFVNIDSCPDFIQDTVLRNTLFTYPSSEWNDFGNTNGFGLQTMRMIWQSQLSLTVDNRVICKAWDTDRNYVVPNVQKTEFLGTPPASGYYNADTRDGGGDGFYPCEPMWLLSGSKNNQLTLNMPEAINNQMPALTVLKAVVVLRGVLAQNSTSIF